MKSIKGLFLKRIWIIWELRYLFELLLYKNKNASEDAAAMSLPLNP